MEKLLIAKILRPQGVKGDVKIALIADKDFDFSKIKQVFIDDTPVSVQKFYSVAGGYAIKFDVINTRNDAELYRNKEIYIDKSVFILPKGKYLMVDLIGKPAVLDSGTNIGKIVDIQNFGSADVIYITGDKNMLCSHKLGLIKQVLADKVILNEEIFRQVAVYEDWYIDIIPRNVCTY